MSDNERLRNIQRSGDDGDDDISPLERARRSLEQSRREHDEQNIWPDLHDLGTRQLIAERHRIPIDAPDFYERAVRAIQEELTKGNTETPNDDPGE